jgi:lysozyme
MGYLAAVDISQWQGAYKDYGTPIVFIKVSGGDDGVYYDSQANNNYNQAKAAGKGIGMYHFAGGKDPVVEADFFVKACSPLEEGDVLVLDWEVQHLTLLNGAAYLPSTSMT